VAIAARFRLACDEVGRMIYLRDSPASFDEHHPLFE
jgi:hypothetical protein